MALKTKRTEYDDVKTLIILENFEDKKQFFIAGYLTPYAIIDFERLAQVEIFPFNARQEAITYIATILFLDFPIALLR